MIVLYIVILIYFNFNITSTVNVFMLSIEKKKSLYKCFEENILFCSNKSRFRKSDSWVNQLLSIVDETLMINCLSLETHSEFLVLDMSKVLISFGMKILYTN